MTMQCRTVVLSVSVIASLALARPGRLFGAPMAIVTMNSGALKRMTPTSAQVALNSSPGGAGVDVTIQPGDEGYPGVKLAPTGSAWDLSKFGHVEARLVNTGAKPISLALRVDNSGDWRDNPWNTEGITLAPGESGAATVIFGYSYGHKPGYALKPASVVNILLFAGKSADVQSFRIESITASGPAGEQPPVAPDAVRVKPVAGKILGPGVTFDPKTQIKALGAHAAAAKDGLRLVFPAAPQKQWVSLTPTMGRWDLRDALEVRVSLRNDGRSAISPRVRVESNGGMSAWVTAPALAPGSKTVLAVPFAGTSAAIVGKPETGGQVTSDAVSAVTIGLDKTDSEAALSVSSIDAAAPPSALPAWLGKRPPVAGDWVKTLDDEFDGKDLNRAVWDIHGPNYWDKQTHWSKDDVILGKGVAALRYEKKTGFNDDDPREKPSDYAAGYLHTYNLWSQRYGYFEARMKLPKAPGLWPAFWMMPDRGAAAGEQWKRQDTGNGGMEFDIMEHLTRWGPHRYNIAMHYDGYGKDHKSVGSDKIYVQPDKDGYLTCGLLWTPGSAVYYCNGREVLRWEDSRISNVPEMLMFTIPQGGWDNSPIDDRTLPDQFTIDYVRVWQRKDLASEVPSPALPEVKGAG